jgi:DNA (cytosine-5)-methyltransferase 1
LWILATDANCQRNAVRRNSQDNAEELAGRTVHARGSQRDSRSGCAESAGESAGDEIPDANRTQRERNERAERVNEEHSDTWQHCRWPDEPNLPRVANGLAYRMDRLKAIGNGQVPRVAAAAFAELSSRLQSVAS